MIAMLRQGLLVACLLWSTMAWGGDPQGHYSFRAYGPDQGLRNLAVTSLAQDAAGYLFVGTEDGLFRYDGEKFHRLGSADAKVVIDDLMVRYVEALVYQAVAENMASEQSARMVAMKAATDNAGNVIKELKLVYNKTRQAAITTELSEIVAGAAAV